MGSDYLFVLRGPKPMWLDISKLQEGEMFGNEEGEGVLHRIY
jgi:hypothetical protein